MFEPVSVLVVASAKVTSFQLAVLGYDPQRGMRSTFAVPN